MKNVILVVSLLLLCFTVQPQSINNVPSQNVTGSGLPANCTNLPCIVYKNALTGQSAAINNLTTYTPTATGVYKLMCSMYITTAGTAGTMQCGFNWHSGVTGNAQSSLSSPTTNMTTQGNTTQVSLIVYADGINPFVLFTNYTGATGTPIYGLDIVVERLL